MMEPVKASSRQSQDRESSETLLSSLPEQEYDFGDLEKLRKRPSRFRPLLCHGLILIIYTLLFLAVASATIPKHQNCHDDRIYTPARPAVRWIRKHQENVIGKTTPYMGKPSPEGDEAWRELLQNSNIRVSEDTLRQMNRSSIALQDGSGMYMAGLSVHHHLHCVKSIRRVLYREYYNLTDEPVMWAHLDHCIEDIRLALICNPDISILTYDWLPNYKRPWGNWHVDGECVDWEKLDGWAGENAFSLFDQKALIHPDLGVAYPMEDGKLNFDSRVHPKASDIESIAKGTNPKGNWGPIY